MSRLKNRDVRLHPLANLLQTILLFSFMLGFLGLAGFLIAGPAGVVWSFVLGLVVFYASRKWAPLMVLRLYRVRPLDPGDAPGLYQLVQGLVARAGLTHSPRLCYVPSAAMNAFTLLLGSQPIIGLSDGLIRNLSGRELTAVLAHELGHIRNRDLTVMGLADVISRLTYNFSLIGQLLLLFSLPLMLLNGLPMPWLFILLLMSLPVLNNLLQFALSRTREFDADLFAVRLTGDPEALIHALEKIEWQQGGVFERIFFPGRRNPSPSLLRTHPETSERIARIRALAERHESTFYPETQAEWLPIRIVRVDHPPRWRWHGLWH